MGKQRSIEAKMARLRGLRESPELLAEARRALRDPSHFVVAEAAEIVGKARLLDLAPDLVEAFERFLDNPVKNDKLCRAKIKIVEALNELDYDGESFYLANARYTQVEPAWPEAQDTGVPVRVGCVFGLVRLRNRDAPLLLVDMLADKEKGVRVGAVQALTYAGTEAAGLLMRLKARLGDEEAEVLSECFTGILALSADKGIPFVAEFFHSPEEAIQEGALLALGSSRKLEAFDPLRAFAEQERGDLREVAYVALALLRLPTATDYLIGCVKDSPLAVAAAALDALAVYRYDPRLRERAAGAVEKNGAAALKARFDKRFAAVKE